VSAAPASVTATSASRRRAAPDDVAFIQHSAGTTGLQKGVALSHRTVLRQIDHLAACLRLDESDRIYSWLPLYHDMGLIACFMLPLVRHVPLVMQDPMTWVMQPLAMLELISKYRCTIGWLPNFAFQFSARRVEPSDREGLDLSSVRALVSCSEPVRARSIDEFLAAFAPAGLRADAVQTSYAMAENVFAVTQSGIGGGATPARLWIDAARLRDDRVAVAVSSDAPGAVCLVSSGRCLPENEIRILDVDGAEMPDDRVGEIVIRSDSLFSGYWNRPDLTAAVLRDGWYRAGDLGFVHGGEVYVLGRKNDMMIIAGKNVYPEDVEAIAHEHPAVHDGRAVALGVDNAETGTEDLVIVAEVEGDDAFRDASAIERAIRQAVSTELGVAVRRVFLKPRGFIVKSTAGKPARRDTRAKLLREHTELSRVSGEHA